MEKKHLRVCLKSILRLPNETLGGGLCIAANKMRLPWWYNKNKRNKCRLEFSLWLSDNLPPRLFSYSWSVGDYQSRRDWLTEKLEYVEKNS